MRIGIDLGGTKTEGALVDSSNAIVHRERRPTPADQGYDAIVENIRALVLQLEERAGHACPVGVGGPGAVERETGKMKNSNTQCLNGKPLQEDLKRLLEREIRLANDADCFTLSEAHGGAGEGKRLVFGVIMGTGVGGGIAIDGVIHQGPNDIAGEWGHSSIDPQGPRCYCGNRGCVETFLSGPGFALAYEGAGGNAITSEEIITRARGGEALARNVFGQYLDRFGRAIANVVNTLDPHVVVLGGGLSRLDELYNEGVKAALPYVYDTKLRTPILKHHFGDSGGVRGAAMLWPAND